MKDEKTTETRPETEMDEAERLRAENESLRAEMYMRSAIYDIETRLAAAGARSPKLLSIHAKPDLQFDEEGKPINTAAIVEHLRSSFPEQFAPEPSGGSIDGGAGRISGPTLTKEALSRMSPAEIQRLDWAEVSGVLST